MSDENLGDTPFSSSYYWENEVNDGSIKQYDLIDLFHSDNIVRPMLDTYAETLRIDKTAVTLPTFAELDALTIEQRYSGYDYWGRSLGYGSDICVVNSNGPIYSNYYYNIASVRPVIVLAA